MQNMFVFIVAIATLKNLDASGCFGPSSGNSLGLGRFDT